MATWRCEACDRTWVLDRPPEPPACQCFGLLRLVEEPVVAAAAPARAFVLRHQETRATIALPLEGIVVIGRDAVGGDVLDRVGRKDAIGDSFVSRRHCELRATGDGWSVTDLGSTNGTTVGIERVDCRAHPGQLLRAGGLLALGPELFVLERAPALPDRSGEPARAVAIAAAAPSVLDSRGAARAAEAPAPGHECAHCGRFRSPTVPFTCPECKGLNR